MAGSQKPSFLGDISDPEFVDNTPLISLVGLVGKLLVVLTCIKLLLSVLFSALL